MAKIKRKCEECGKAIPKARLDALPDTTLCLVCAEELEDIGMPNITYDSCNMDDCLDIISGDN